MQAGQTLPCYDADFYPFGRESTVYTNTCPQNYKFTGKERDETSLDNLGARYHSSQYGRFMTPDWATKPKAVPYADFSDPRSLNLYSYVRNNPLLKEDLDGHCPQCVAGFFLGAAFGATSEYFGARLAGRQVTLKDLGVAALRGGIVGTVAAATGGMSLAVGIAATASANVATGVAERTLIEKQPLKQATLSVSTVEDLATGAAAGMAASMDVSPAGAGAANATTRSGFDLVQGSVESFGSTPPQAAQQNPPGPEQSMPAQVNRPTTQEQQPQQQQPQKVCAHSTSCS